LTPGQGGCSEGGITVEVEGSGTKKSICNGEGGPEGPEGKPWVPDGTLPVAATETGAFATSSIHANFIVTSITFNIPLATALDGTHVQSNPIGFPAEDETICNAKDEPEKAACLAALATAKTNCPGSGANPKAASGFLCVYTMARENLFDLDPPVGPIIRGRASIQKLNSTAYEEEVGANVSGASLFFTPGDPSQLSKVSGSFAVTG